MSDIKKFASALIPALDSFVSKFDSDEKIGADADGVMELVKQVNSGAPIPTVSVSDLKQLHAAIPRINADSPPRPNTAVGLGVYAAYGVEAASDPKRFMSVQWRHQLISDLIARGILRDYMHGEELDDKVFAAAAVMPCNLDDLGQTMIPRMLAQMPDEQATKIMNEMRAQGYDPESRSGDAKVLDWLQNNC